MNRDLVLGMILRERIAAHRTHGRFSRSEGVFVSDLGRPPSELVTEARVLPYLDDGSLVMAVHQGRGMEMPGGIRVDGESIDDSVISQVFEQTGCVVHGVVPVGFRRFECRGSLFDGARGSPEARYRQYFAAHVVRMEAVEDGAEFLQPMVVSPEEAARVLYGDAYYPHRRAVEVLFDGEYEPGIGVRTETDGTPRAASPV